MPEAAEYDSIDAFLDAMLAFSVDGSDVEDSDIFEIPITKAGKGTTIKVNWAGLSAATKRDAAFRGLKAIINAKMTQQSSTKDMDEKDAADTREVLVAIAKENLKAAYEGKVRKAAGSKQAGVTQRERTETMRVIKHSIKMQIKANGEKITSYKPKDITAMAKEIFETDPKWLKIARENIAKQDEENAGVAINLEGLTPDPVLVKKNDERKAKDKAKRAAASPKRQGRDTHATR
jgi:hypothetical protein